MENKNLNVNLNAAQLKQCVTVKCDKCGGVCFRPTNFFKCIPGIMIGAGAQSQYIPIHGAFVCEKCGELAPFCKNDPCLAQIINLKENENVQG